MSAAPSRSSPLRAALPWLAFALVLGLAPLVFSSSKSINMLSQMGYLIIILLSYNLKMGQGGMLSFGHAAYTGLGSFAAAIAINWASKNGAPIPLVLMPLAGGLMGALVSIPLGYVSTRKAGITFAMITLGLGELVAAIAVMLPDVFGGDAGISIDRVYGKPLLGYNFGPQIQVYYLIAVYCLVCTALMYAFTATPLGRMLNAVRDNPERVSFIGYNTELVRWYAFIVSGFFAGIGGALMIITHEIFSSLDAMGLMATGSFLLFTFLGGVTLFFGPIIGAVLMVLTMVLLSDFTSAWLLYLGLIFLVMVMYAPGGVASIIVANVRMLRSRNRGRMLLPYAGVLATGAALLLAVAALIEMIYHHQLDAMSGPTIDYLGLELDTTAALVWIGMLVLLVATGLLFVWMRRAFLRAWNAAPLQAAGPDSSGGV